MNAIADVPQIPDQLRRLLEAGGLSDAAHRTGKRLLERLEADIRIVIAGPHATGRTVLFDILKAEALPRTSLTMQEEEADFHPEGADLCLWCTHSFDAEEQELWNRAPDRLKDHSLLVPMTDPENAPRHFSQAFLEALEQIAAEEFYGLFPVILPAQNAAEPTAQITELLGEVAGIVHAGMLADADNAQMFLAAHASGTASAKVASSQPVPAPVAALEKADLIVADDARAYQTTIDALRHHLDGLAPFLHSLTDTDSERILGLCETAATAASEAFLTADPEAAAAHDLGNSLQAAADDILLLSLEGGVSPAITAVTTLLQIKRSLEVEIASREAVFT